MSERTTVTRARIKRASARARAAMDRYASEVLAELEATYRRARRDIEAQIAAYGGQEGVVRLAVLQQLLQEVTGRIAALGQARNDLLTRGLEQAAKIGASPMEGVLAAAELDRLASGAVRFVTSYIGEDGLQLSQRLWRLDRGARDTLSQTIQSAVVRGQGPAAAVQSVLASVSGVSEAEINTLSGAETRVLAQQVGGVLMNQPGNLLEAAMRVFRTEINRAHGEAYQATALAHPDAAGTRFLLSPRHPRPDICDMHARANVFGMGPGVYPPGKNPWPAHPRTLSYVEVVFADEISDSDRRGATTRIEWLQQQPRSVQESILGKRKRALLEAGILTEGQITTPLYVLERLYAQRGITIDQLPVSPVPPTLPRPSRLAPAGRPVSSAVDPQALTGVSRRVLDAIDSVHGDGNLPQTPIRRYGSADGAALGVYRWDPSTLAGVIRILPGGPYPEFTLAHELGHLLDHQGVIAGKFASELAREFGPWLEASQSSSAVRGLLDLLNGPERIELRGVMVRVPKDYIAYLLDPREVWARSYAQYVAVRSGDPVLLEQLARAQRPAGVLALQRQWQEEDFQAIMEAIDEVFYRLGWLDDADRQKGR